MEHIATAVVRLNLCLPLMKVFLLKAQLIGVLGPSSAASIHTVTFGIFLRRLKVKVDTSIELFILYVGCVQY